MFEVRDLQVANGQAPALWGVSFRLRQRELLCVVGHNGAGKTTLINTLAGMLRATPGTAGRIIFEGQDITALAPHRFCAAGIAIVPEGRRLFASMSVREILEIGSLLPAAKARHSDSLAAVLALFPALERKLAQAAGERSGGQQQMVAIGRAQMVRPRLLLLDEPSLGLSPLIVSERRPNSSRCAGACLGCCNWRSVSTRAASTTPATWCCIRTSPRAKRWPSMPCTPGTCVSSALWATCARRGTRLTMRSSTRLTPNQTMNQIANQIANRTANVRLQELRPCRSPRTEPAKGGSRYFRRAVVTSPQSGDEIMCKLCDEGRPQDDAAPRREFLKATGAAAAGMGLFTPLMARADDERDRDRELEDSGRHGRRYVIRRGAVMSMDPSVGDFARADVLVEGKKILAVGPNLNVGGAAVVDARGCVAMPGFIDTHHHLFETSLRSYLADGLLFNDGQVHSAVNYFGDILGRFAPVYRPQDVYISELFGSLSQLDAGVTTAHDISRIYHSPQHSDAVIKALGDSGRRAVFGYFESAGGRAGNQYPADARRIKQQYFSSSDHLLTMVMGGEIDLPSYEAAWTIGRELGIPVAAHIVGSFGMRPEFDSLAAAGAFGPNNLFIHMTGMSGLPELLTTRDLLRFATLKRRARPQARPQGGLADSGQGSRHHPRRRGHQRRRAEPCAGRGGVADGAQQRRDRHRGRQGAKVEGPHAQRQPAAAAP